MPSFSAARRQSITVSGANVLTPILPTIIPGLANPAQTYDTWSLHYEGDGIQQNPANSGPDQGTNGLDDNGVNGVDELAEHDTQAPFAAQLRGIRVIIRDYEPSSQQVREVTVEQDFLP